MGIGSGQGFGTGIGIGGGLGITGTIGFGESGIPAAESALTASRYNLISVFVFGARTLSPNMIWPLNAVLPHGKVINHPILVSPQGSITIWLSQLSCLPFQSHPVLFFKSRRTLLGGLPDEFRP